METKKLVMVGGAGVGAYLLYRWWQGRQQPSVPVPLTNGVVAPRQPAPPTAFVPAPAAAAPAKPAAAPVMTTPPAVVAPTEQQVASPAYWESVARSIVVEIGLGALPPWPGIGPVPHPYLGPTYSLTQYR